MTQITTPELLRDGVARTGLPLPVLLRIVAKSALIRHVAERRNGLDFVLKGGTLLHHVYASPRFSVKDADYTHIAPERVDEQRLNAALTVAEPDFTVDFSTVEWTRENAIWSTDVGYTMGLRDVPAGREGLKITVSVRFGEWLDKQNPVLYSDPLLAGQSSFKLNGLSLEELAAEKILAWCTKRLEKHAVDLAYLARDHSDLNRAKTLDLTRQKFVIESHMPRYPANGIREFSDLAKVLVSPDALRTLRRNWPSDLLMPGAELRHPTTLREVTNVERLLQTFWLPVLS